jgi:hypothetical protein
LRHATRERRGESLPADAFCSSSLPHGEDNRGARPGKSGTRLRCRQGAKRDRKAVTAKVVVQTAPPPGSRIKGAQHILVRELALTPEVVCCRQER